MLQKIGNDKVASAIGDTLLRNGSGNGAKYIQQAINVSQPNDKVEVGGGYGSKTHSAIEDISADPQKSKIFLDELASLRKTAPKYTSGEQARIDYYKY